MRLAKFLVIAVLVGTSTNANAGIPTIDFASLIQNILIAIENVSQTAQQLKQYQTQLQQYQNDLRNSTRPSTYVWDDANQTISKILNTIDTIEAYKRQAGGLENYLSKYKDAAAYRSNPCFTTAGCSSQQLEEMRQTAFLASTARKRSNDAVLKGLDKQQDQLKKDARTLTQLQQNAETAQGQMEAIQLANQLASHQNTQLMQIRTLMVQEQATLVAASQDEADRRAKEIAAAEQWRKGEFKKSDEKKY